MSEMQEITRTRRGFRSSIEIGEMPSAVDVARLLIHVFPAASSRPALDAERREVVLAALALLDGAGLPWRPGAEVEP